MVCSKQFVECVGKEVKACISQMDDDLLEIIFLNIGKDQLCFKLDKELDRSGMVSKLCTLWDYGSDEIKSLSEKWLYAKTFTICNMQNRSAYSDVMCML